MQVIECMKNSSNPYYYDISYHPHYRQALLTTRSRHAGNLQISCKLIAKTINYRDIMSRKAKGGKVHVVL